MSVKPLSGHLASSVTKESNKHIAAGMHPQGHDLQSTQYDDRGWRATFYTTGMEHSPTSATGTARERTPWHATQRAAWEAMTKDNDRISWAG